MRAFFIGLVLALGLVSASFAAEDSAPAAAPAAPAADQRPAVRTIFDYQKELGLADKQVEDMKKLMTDLQATLGGKSTELAGLRKDLAEMLMNKQDIQIIKKQMQKIANLQVDNSCQDIIVSRKVEAILKPQQLTQWKGIQQKFMEEMKAAQAMAQAPAPAPEQPMK